MQSSGVRPGLLSLPSQGAIIGIVVVIVTVTGLGFIVSRRLASGAPAAEPVTAEVARRNLNASVSTTGTVVSTATSRLAFKAPGRISEVLVNVGDQVTAGQILARQDASDLEPAVLQAQANLLANEAKLAAMLDGPRREDIAAAQASLAAAQAKLASMQTGSTEDEVRAAQAGLDSALLKLRTVQAGPTPEDVTVARSAVTTAQANLDNARYTLDQIRAGPTEAQRIEAQAALSAAHSARASAYAVVFDGHAINASPSARNANTAKLASAEAALKAAEAKYQETIKGATEADRLTAEKNLTLAEASLQSAEAKLALVLAGPDPADVATAQAAVLNAQNTLSARVNPHTEADFMTQDQAIKTAAANLAAKREPYAPSDILTAQAAVVKAQADLATAQANLAGSTLIAPFNGVVSALTMSVGETAITTGNSPSSITVVDPGQVRVDVQVDEADIAQVEIGQPVQVTFDALAGRPMQGRVIAVAPSGTLTQGVVGYPVAVELRNARGVRAGMTATAEIVYQSKDNVIAVPNRAIVRQGRERFVDVQTATGTERRRIEVGMANDQFTEVTAGLNEGETVILPQTAARASVPGAGAIVGGPGGPQQFPAPGGGTLLIR